MVAITVILAAVIGTFVIGLGDDLGGTAPSASFDTNFDNEDTFTFTHRGGDRIPANESFVTLGGEFDSSDIDEVTAGGVSSAEEDDRYEIGSSLSAGSTVIVTFDVEDETTGTLSLVFDDGSRSSTLSSAEITVDSTE